MIWACLSLVLVGFAVSLPGTWLARRVGRRLGALDSAGVPGQVKAAARKVPNTGGVGIFLGFAAPVVAGLVVLRLLPAETAADLVPGIAAHLPGLAERTPMAVVLLLCALVLHVVGLIDDRRALGPFVKLAVMVGVAAAAVIFTRTRLLELLDARVGGPWLSIAVTVLWIVVVTNAMNFLDNMDGLSGGVGFVAAACFAAAALIQGQWFVGACFALLAGALLGFLVFNVAPASVFMGDGGSLVVGFLLSFLAVRITYFDGVTGGPASGAWYGVLMPLVVLAVPLYDFVSVTLIRLSQGRSPFVGDLQHVSHRMVERGLSRPAAVAVIWGLAGVTGVAGIALGSLKPWQAGLVGAQVLLVLLTLAAFERFSRMQHSPQGHRDREKDT